MERIALDWTEGNQVRKLNIIMPTGNAGVVQIMLDNWYLGQGVNYKGEWNFYLNKKSQLVANDLEVIIDRLGTTLVDVVK